MKHLLSNSSYQAWIDSLLLLCIIAISYSIFAGVYPLQIPDEARYSEIAREMLAQGQYITPTLNGLNFFDKPILYYWIQIIAMQLLGVNEWGVRLGPMVMGTVGIFATFFLTRKVSHRKAAWVAALVLASSPFYYMLAHYANMDVEVTAWLTACLASFLIAYEPDTKTFKAGWLYLSYLCAAGAILTKGLIGIVFPIMIIGLWVLINNQWALVRKMRIISGLGLTLVLVLPWFILVSYKNPSFLYFYVYVQQIQRFLLPSFNNQQPWWFYFQILLFGFLPWIIALPFAIKSSWQQRNLQWWFLFIWPLAIFIFFNLTSARLMGYILPIFPPLAMLIGISYDKIPRLVWQVIAGLEGLLFAVIIVAAIFFQPLVHGLSLQKIVGQDLPIYLSLVAQYRYIVVIACLICLGVLGWSLTRKHQALALAIAVINLFMFNVVLGCFAMLNPSLRDNFFPVKAVAQQIQPLLTPQDEVVTFYNYYQDLPFYVERPVLIVHDWDDKDLAQEDNWRGKFAYARDYLQPTDAHTLIQIPALVQLWHSPQRVFVFVKTKRLSDLEQALQIQAVCKVAQVGSLNVVTNDEGLCAGHR